MKPTTIRFSENTLAELDREYEEYGYRDRTEYIRDIIDNRHVVVEHTETTEQNTRTTTGEYTNLEERVAQLEERVDDLESAETAYREPEPIEDPDPPRSRGGVNTSETTMQDEPDVVEWLRENQPAERREIIEACQPANSQIKGRSWWVRHAKEDIEEAGAEHVRNVGWVFE